MQSVTVTGADRDAAHLWLIRRDKDATPDLEASFQQWLEEKPQHRKAYEEASRLWQVLHQPAARIANRQNCLVKQKPRRSFAAGGWGHAIAASCLLVIGTSLWFGDPAFVQNWRADVITGRGDTRTITLPDGSTATLGADTALSLDFSDKAHRDVALLRGQVFFNVAHGKETRFIVRSGESRIEVTGTAFDVDRHESETTVTVQQGSVNVSGTKSTALVSLGPSQRVVVGNGIPGTAETVDLDLELAWMNGQVIFDRQPLSKIIATLQRYIPATIIVRPGTGDEIVSGSFQTDNAEETLRAVTATVGASVKTPTPWTIIVF